MSSDTHQYLVSFIINGQPQTQVLCTSEETLDVPAALELLRMQMPGVDLSAATDVQVQKRTRTEQTEGVPGHYQQP
jgi:hypothetical protein